MKDRTRSDVTRFQTESIKKWDYDMEQIKAIKAKTQETQAVLDKFVTGEIDVHRTNGRRIFNPFTSMKRSHRQHISYMGDKLIEVDAKNSHPLIMVHKMKQEGLKIEKDVEIAVMSGTFYDYLTEPGLTRDQVKESWFSFCYNKKVVTDHKVYKRLAAIFPDFLESFEKYATGRSLSEYLQELESRVWVDKVSTALMRAGVYHATIHDSVVFHGVQHLNKVLDIIEAAFAPIKPPLHVNYLDDTPIQYTRVEDQDNAKYLNPDWKILEELEQRRADPFKRINKPETSVYIIDNDIGKPLLTLGNFSTITGKMKSGKSHLISAIVAASLSSDYVLDKFVGKLPSDKRCIIYFDTEQSEYDFQWSMKKIIDLTDMKPADINKYISFYRIREDNKAKRIELIDTAIKSTKNVGLVIIDGIRELVMDINSQEESTTAINLIMKWTDVYNIHLLTVLHHNPVGTGNKVRGAIGTEAMNKAEAIISVNRNEGDDFACVKFDYMRREPISEFNIGHDENNLPVIIEVDNKPTVWSEPSDQTMDDHKAAINRLFENKTEYGLTTFKKTAKDFLLMLGLNTSARKITAWVDFWELAGLIKISNDVDRPKYKKVTKQ